MSEKQKAPSSANREAAPAPPEQSREAPRVCILLDGLGPGGIETTALTQCRSLLAAGFKVDLLRLKRGDWMLPMVPDGVRAMTVQALPPRPEKTLFGKIARLFLPSPPSPACRRRRFNGPAKRNRPLILASEALHHARAALTWNGLRAFLRMRRLNRRAAKEQRREDIVSFTWMAQFASHASQLSRYIEREKPDALYSVLPNANIAALLTRRLTSHKPRLVPSFHSRVREDICPDAFAVCKGGKGNMALLSALLPEADAVHAVSRGLADEAAQICNIRREAVTVLHNPAFHNGIPDLKRERVPHPWIAQKDGEKVILWAGRAAPEKDLQTLLRAFRILCGRRKARLILLGIPKKWGEKMTRRRAGDIKDRILCPGFADNPFIWMARADVFVLCSRYESLSNVLIEAMACGCPVVSTDCPHGPREILEDGRWGRLTPPGDAEALAAAIDATLENPPAAEDLVARARVFSEDRIMPQWMEMLGVLSPPQALHPPQALLQLQPPAPAQPPPP